MDDADVPMTPDQLAVAADRLAGMADTAELMGDAAGAERFRTRSTQFRLLAMRLLD